MKKYALTLAQEAERIRASGRREPCRTLKEMADEFGTSHFRLIGLMRTRGGPKPVLVSSGHSGVRWYSPREVRKWWREINQ